MFMDRNSIQPLAATPSTWNIDQVVEELRHSREVEHNVRHQGRMRELPSRKALMEVLDGVCAVLFPSHYGRSDVNESNIDFFVGDQLHLTLGMLQDQVRRGLLFISAQDEQDEAPSIQKAIDITSKFAAQLPTIRARLFTDLQAAYQGDPAATSSSEILLCYPGMTAVIYYRVAHALYELGARLPARLISDIAHSTTGIDIHPAATIGGYFFIDHGTGVVIGETTIIGERVRLYQAVTLGAKRFQEGDNGMLLKGNARHPIVADDVVIYAGATILGRITIGKGSIIGGNVWLTYSVPPGSNVLQAQMRNTTVEPKHLIDAIHQPRI